jgi:hypothetical protein
MVLSRRSLGTRATAALALSLFAVALAAILTGCGSSQEETAPGTAPERDASAIDSGDGSEPRAGNRRPPVAAAGEPKGEVKNSPKQATAGSPAAAGDPAGTGDDRSTDPKEPGKAATAAPAGCPPNLTRKECAARVTAQVESEESPSYPVSTPSDCVEALGKERCEEIASAQKDALEGEGGRSIDPNTCLQEYSREYCEARLGEQYEQQREASQAAR